MTEITVKLRGLSSIMMNPMTDDTLDSLITGIRKPVIKDRPMEDIASERIYRDDQGRMGIPTINLISALKSAGRAIKNGKKAISTATTTTMFSFLEFPDEFLPFDDLDEKGEIPWRVDKRRGVMKSGATQVAVGIIRPKFDKWGFTVKVKLNEKLLREETLKALFVEAGTNAGLCDFRPSKNGPFGRFEVVDFRSSSNGNGASSKIKDVVASVAMFCISLLGLSSFFGVNS
jgi:hypothetical protein